MSDPRHVLGLAAEEATARWLGASGWRVIARRQRSASGGEADLVALDRDGILVAIEVRARRSARAGAAAMTVDARRVGRLRRTLSSVARSSGGPYRGLRVDLVTAEPAPGLPGRWHLARIPGIG